MDVTLEHYQNRRMLDYIKEQVIHYIREEFFADDMFYLYHPQIIEMLLSRGEQVGAVSNYDTDGWKFDLEYALKQTLYIIGAEDADSPKLLCVVSNRQHEREDWLYKKILKLNEKDSYDCKVLHIALGVADRVEIENPRFKSVKLEGPELILGTLKEMEYGRSDDLHCQAGLTD